MARKKAEESIPRPANCFFHFLSDKVKDCQKKGNWNNRSMADFAKEISKMWKEAPQSERDNYIAKALTAKEEHKRRHPDYRYRPRKRSKKMAVSKTGDTNSPSTSASPSPSSTSSSASTPAPTTPIMTTLAGRSSTFGNAFSFNFGEGSYLNHHIPPDDAHATGLPYAAQSDDYLWSPQVAGWTDPSTSISMPQNDSFALLPKGDGSFQRLSQTSYCQPHPSYAPQQAFPPFVPGLQLQTGAMNQQPPQPPPQRTFQSVPQQSLDKASQMTFNPVSLPLQAHANAVPAQAQSESLFAMDDLKTTELEAWDKEFAPLDAGFCDFSSAWNDVKASDTPVSASPAIPLPATDDGPSGGSAALPPTVADNLNVNVDGDPAQALLSETQDPPLSSPSAFFDPSFLFPLDDPLGQQYNHLYDPLQDLPPSAVWPEELNCFGIQM
ncbi:hypothetical protein V8D89_008746 [Ganoderma adspersum]